MAKQSPAEKAIEKHGVSGETAVDFVQLLFGRMRQSDAERLTEKFAAVIKADNKLARIRGQKFESDPTRAEETAYQAKSVAVNDRDENFARKLPHTLRKTFLDVVVAEKTASYERGRQDMKGPRSIECRWG